jgi:hypothetical protein
MGWDADDDEDETEDAVAKEMRLKGKQAEAEKQADLQRLKQATGQAIQLMEGTDDGVLGQEWVEATLSKAKVWPPEDIGLFENATFEYNGNQVSAMDWSATKRVRLAANSQMLNCIPTFEAGPKVGDYTYFERP